MGGRTDGQGDFNIPHGFAGGIKIPTYRPYFFSHVTLNIFLLGVINIVAFLISKFFNLQFYYQKEILENNAYPMTNKIYQPV